MPMLPRKAFATLSLKYFFLWDVWFGGQIVCYTIEHPWIINKIDGFLDMMEWLHNMVNWLDNMIDVVMYF